MDRLPYFDILVDVCVVVMVKRLDINMPLKSGFMYLQKLVISFSPFLPGTMLVC